MPDLRLHRLGGSIAAVVTLGGLALLAPIGSPLGSRVAVRAASTPVTMLTMDFVGGGGHNEGAVYSLTSPQDGDIEGAPNPWRPDPGASLSFTILPEGEGNGTSFWDLEFLAPQGELLQPGGHYISGTTPDSPDAFFALLSGYECVSTGATFDVLEISVDAEGVAQTFAASFSATCVGGEAHGEICVNSTVPVVAAEMGPLYVNLPMTELGSPSAPRDVTLES